MLKEWPDITSASLALLRILALDTAGCLPAGFINLILELESNFRQFDGSADGEDIMVAAMEIGRRITGLKHDLSKVWTLDHLGVRSW